jgi:hypothetical protein
MTPPTLEIVLQGLHDLIAPMPRATLTKRASQIEKQGGRSSRRSAPKISALKKAAVRIMRKLYKATGGQPQRWEPLGNLGALKADAAGSG